MDVEHLWWERWKEGKEGGRRKKKRQCRPPVVRPGPQVSQASSQASQGWAGLRTPALPVSGGWPWRGAALAWIWPQDWGEGVGAEAPISRAPSPGELVMRFPDPHSH